MTLSPQDKGTEEEMKTERPTTAPRPTLEDLNRWMVVGFDRLYGLEFDALSDMEVTAHVRIAEQHKQPTGIVHGGLYASIAESIATIAAVVSVAGEGNTAIGLSNSTPSWSDSAARTSAHDHHVELLARAHNHSLKAAGAWASGDRVARRGVAGGGR
jgi:acyl-coenzyme A thioesterase PaaI-like protein